MNKIEFFNIFALVKQNRQQSLWMNAASTAKPNLTVQPDEEEEEEYLHWVRRYVERPGHEFFCMVDTDFIMDRFNLTNLGRSVPNAEAGYDNLLRGSNVPDSSEMDSDSSDDDSKSPHVEMATTLIFGLLHQRFIITPYGLSAMKKKYVAGDFGRCPRYLCEGQHVLPVGVSDTPRRSSVKLYCPRCQDIYQPRTNIHTSIDGAFFGTSFPQVFLMHYKMDTKPVPAGIHRHPTLSHSLNPLRVVHGTVVKEAMGDGSVDSSEASDDDFDALTDAS